MKTYHQLEYAQELGGKVKAISHPVYGRLYQANSIEECFNMGLGTLRYDSRLREAIGSPLNPVQPMKTHLRERVNIRILDTDGTKLGSRLMLTYLGLMKLLRGSKHPSVLALVNYLFSLGKTLELLEMRLQVTHMACLDDTILRAYIMESQFTPSLPMVNKPQIMLQ